MIYSNHAKVIISIVSYNNVSEVDSFFSVIEKQKCNEIIVLVTCNSAADYRKIRSIRFKYSLTINVYSASNNLGYLKGCLYGINQFLEDNNQDGCYNDSWFMISNTDISINQDNFFRQIISGKYEKAIACIAPRITLIDGKEQNPFLKNRPSSQKVYVWWKLQGNPVLYYAYSVLSNIKNNIRPNNNLSSSSYIYAPHGSCFLIRNVPLIKKLWSNDRIFMYGEEIFIAEEIRKNNLKVKFDSNLQIIHKENSTTSKAHLTQKSKWYNASFNFLYNNYFNME